MVSIIVENLHEQRWEHVLSKLSRDEAYAINADGLWRLDSSGGT